MEQAETSSYLQLQYGGLIALDRKIDEISQQMKRFDTEVEQELLFARSLRFLEKEAITELIEQD